MDTDAAAARERLRARVRDLARLAASALETPISAPPFDPQRIRRIHATGLGSSEAHARLFVACLADTLGLDAHFLPTGALLEGAPADASRDGLIVFSQGLSPNARIALRDPAAWGAVALATAVPDSVDDNGRAQVLDALRACDGWRVGFPPADEYGSLVRVGGPLTGCITAIRMAQALGTAAGLDVAPLRCEKDALLAALRSAPERARRALAAAGESALDAPLGFLASGQHAGLLHNLRLKWLETLLRPLPPAWELLDFSHGPFQQSLTQALTWVALTRADAHGEDALLTRLETMLEPDRHRLLRLRATLPGPWALVEHEALVDELVLHALFRSDVDPERWPGRDADGALYALDTSPGGGMRDPSPTAQKSRPARLDLMTSPEVAAQLAAGDAEIVVPLGATEQHGAHLPLATDRWIADALAERLCERHSGLLRLPALALGCSSEHASFAGTLSLAPETLVALLSDLLGSLAARGFSRVFLFSAHGGNCAPLATALPALRSTLTPMRVDAFTDLARLSKLQHEVAAAQGVAPAAAGHHAGEVETSILLARVPGQVRREALAPGLLHDSADAQTLFYPNLSANAPNGVVGDPRHADPARAEPYLDAWVSLLDEAYCAEASGPSEGG